MPDSGRFAATASAYDLPEPSFDAELTLVGKGTPMGELLRRYWHPVLKSDKLVDVPVRVKALGDEIILFRKPTGEAGALYPRCVHRGTDLIWGRPTESGLRCCYHGWTFETDGTCTAQPCEPNNGGKGRNAVRQPWYPVEELYGLIFVYLGPLERKPALPRYDILEELPEGMELYADDTTIPSAGAGYMPCNWLQHHENGVDPAHVPIVHERQFPAILAKSELVHTVDRLPDRICGRGVFTRGPDRLEMQVELLMPTVRIIPHPLLANLRPDGKCDNVAWTLPKDDTDTMVFTVGVKPAGFDLSVTDDVYDGKAWRDMSFEEHQRHPGDFEAQVGQGPITLHSEEHLVSSDRGIVFFRRMLKSALADITEGRDPPLSFGAEPILIESAASVKMMANPDYVPVGGEDMPSALAASPPSAHSESDPGGSWALSLMTPMGEQKLQLEIETAGGELSGFLSDGGERSPLYGGQADGPSLSWKVDVTRPLPMTMAFAITVTGDTLSGTFKPGMFPEGKLSGNRVASAAAGTEPSRRGEPVAAE